MPNERDSEVYALLKADQDLRQELDYARERHFVGPPTHDASEREQANGNEKSGASYSMLVNTFWS